MCNAHGQAHPRIAAGADGRSGDGEPWPTPLGPNASAVASAIAGGAPPLPPRHAHKKTRRKLWELPHKLHCPVIGTCLEHADLQRIARSNDGGGVANGEYALHVRFVSAADDRNALSIAAHKALERRFAAQVRRFAKARDTATLAGLWDEARVRGEVAGALWATLTHPQCDDALRTRLFEEVHMLSHQIGAGQRADLQRLSRAESELEATQRAFDDLQRRTRRQLEDREHQVRGLQRRLADSEASRRRAEGEDRQLRERLAELQRHGDAARVAELEAQLAAARASEGRLQAALERERERAASTQAALDGRELECRERQADCAALERLVADALGTCDHCTGDACIAGPDLRGRRILCVGGRHRLIDQYRELVARCNGRFEHHDGGVEDNRQRLESMLSAADAVVCAADCISHDAYYRLKRFCKRHAKPHVFLRSSGISTFARALDHMAG